MPDFELVAIRFTLDTCMQECRSPGYTFFYSFIAPRVAMLQLK